jgi:arylsulfatase
MAKSSRPNVLFLFPDQWRWDFLGCAEDDIPVKTPNVDALAARGVRFTQCRTNSPVCAPSRSCLVQGVRYDRCGVPSNHTDTDTARPTFMKQLQAVGYQTAGCGKFDLFKPTRNRGVEGWTDRLGEIGFTRGYDQSGKFDCANHGWPEPQDFYSSHLHARGLMEAHVADYQRRKENRESGACGTWPSPLPRESHTDEFAAHNAIRLLEELPADEPWYLWVNIPGPHDPFDPPAEFHKRYADVDFAPPINPNPEADPVELNQQRRSYAACCEHIDELCGRIIATVDQRGELDNTLIIFASDHGEMLGDHGRWTKSLPHEPSVHVPLIIAGPGVANPGRTHDGLVELIDLAATITDAAGAAPVEGWDSQSLTPALAGQTDAHRDIAASGLRKWRLAFDGRYKLIITEDQPDQLFDLQEDPNELHNCIDEVDAGIVESLRHAIQQSRVTGPA